MTRGRLAVVRPRVLALPDTAMPDGPSAQRAAQPDALRRPSAAVAAHGQPTLQAHVDLDSPLAAGTAPLTSVTAGSPARLGGVLPVPRAADSAAAAPVAGSRAGLRPAGALHKVVMAGPLPPAVGGMASVLGALRASSLAGRVDLRLFDTGKTTPPDRPLWQGLAARARLMADWWRLLGRAAAPGGADVVCHIHTCSGLTFFLDGALLLLARLRGARIVLHVHGARFDDFLDGLAAPTAALARWLAQRAAVVVVLSPDWQQRLAARWPAARLVVVANGVPAPPRAADVAAPGEPCFVFLGNLGRRKGVHLLLQAVALARARWQLALVGGDEEPGFTAWAASEIDRLGIASRVRLHGPLVGQPKDALLAAAQGFVLPSLAEGLPMALLEAMAAGLPVVVSDAGAMPEVVRHGVDGWVVPAGEAATLADALDALAGAPAQRRRFGDSAAARCQALYGIERMADALLAVYAGLPGSLR